MLTTKYLTIPLTGTTDSPIELTGFYGSGAIVLEAETLGGTYNMKSGGLITKVAGTVL